MAMGSERKAISMPRPRSLDDILGMSNGPPAVDETAAPPPEREMVDDLPPLEELSPLPKPGDPYKAHSRANRTPLATLHVLLTDASVRGFSYANFDSIDLLPSNEPGGGPVIVVRFAGLVPCELLIVGRNLDLLHVQLGNYRIAWIRELPTQGNFSDKTAPLIRRVMIKPLERE
jgi:hypothetical protein